MTACEKAGWPEAIGQGIRKMKQGNFTGILFAALIAYGSAALASPAPPRDAEQAGDWSGRTGSGLKP
jgi:hypothetical protein